MNKLIKILEQLVYVILTIWQLPQIILGIILLSWYRKSIKFIKTTNYDNVYACDINGGISLGTIILINKYECDNSTINHELGHSKQSRILGPLYLIIIGIPSIFHAWLNKYIKCCEKHKEGYYHFYTEKWAEKLAKTIK